MDEAHAVATVLAEEHERALARVAHLTDTVGAVIESSDETLADDEHDPEGATIAFERAQVAALLRDARVYLTDVERARKRLHEGTYGICEGCREPIALERLAARPATSTCLQCATKGRSPVSR